MDYISTAQAFLGLMPILAVMTVFIVFMSFRKIGPTEVGLVTKRWWFKKLSKDNLIAFNGEAGYQADLLMPGIPFKLWPLYSVKKFPWVQVPANEIGVVIAQAGGPLPIGAKSAVYKKELGNFSDLRSFVANGGEKGVQRPVLSPGTLAPIHPVGFLVITKEKVYGLPVSPELQKENKLSPASFGLSPKQLEVVRIEPKKNDDGEIVDRIGIVTVFEGQPLPSGDIAGRLGGFKDVSEMMADANVQDDHMVEVLLGHKNDLHNNYQDFQAFLDKGGRIGLQYDPILYGAYNLNPFLVSVEMVPMLVVKQGEAAVIKSYVGLVTEDTSGESFKFGSLVRPGRRGIWQEPLRTGKYAINPRCYQAEVVPTSILTLNWAEATSQAHNLDKHLSQIEAKSREGFIFKIDLQVQIHIPDKMAPKVISMVGTIQNLVNEVLQAAVGNHFRDKIQSLQAIDFIGTRQQVQEQAFAHVTEKLSAYHVETRGVYIQDVVLPVDLVKVLTEREIANQNIQTFEKQKDAEDKRIDMEKSKGMANEQAKLATSEVGITIEENNAKANKAKAAGDAALISEKGKAQGAEVEAVGLAYAKGYREQVAALGQGPTALVNALKSLAEKRVPIVPEIMVSGNGSSAEGVLALLMSYLSKDTQNSGGKKEAMVSK